MCIRDSATCQEAKIRFEKGDWQGVHNAVKDRIRFYDDRVDECVDRLTSRFPVRKIDRALLQNAKLLYIGMLLDHKQPELAETFFNSVITKMLHRAYYHNDFIFVRPALSTEYISTDEATPTYQCYYASEGIKSEVRQIVLDFGWQREFADLDHDIDCLLRAVHHHLGEMPHREVNFQLQILSSPFYRNKAAYIIGKAINGAAEYPFTIPVLHLSLIHI